MAKQTNNLIGSENDIALMNNYIKSSPALNSAFNTVGKKDFAGARDVMQQITGNPMFQNEFANAITNKFSLTLNNNQDIMTNVLAKYKRGTTEYGDTIEERFNGFIKEYMYDLYGTDVFQIEEPNIQATYHKINRRSKYKYSVATDVLSQAAKDGETLSDVISDIYGSVKKTKVRDEYNYMRRLFTDAYRNGDLTLVEIGDVTSTEGTAKLLKKARAYNRKFTFPNRYNARGVENVVGNSDMISVVIDADTEAEVSVDQLARAFNMEKADFIGTVDVLDRFEDDNLKMVIFDNRWMMVYDNRLVTQSIQNPDNLVTNYFDHVWQTISYSPFQTAVGFVEKLPEGAESRLIVDTPVMLMKQEVGSSASTTLDLIYTDGYKAPEDFTWEFTAESDRSSLDTTFKDNVATFKWNKNMAPGEYANVVITATPKLPEGSTSKLPGAQKATVLIQAAVGAKVEQ